MRALSIKGKRNSRLNEIQFKEIWKDCMLKAVLPLFLVLLSGIALGAFSYPIAPVVLFAFPVAWWSSRYILKHYKCPSCGCTLVSGDVLLYPKSCPKCDENLLGKNT